jgi:hypothetical protein
MKKHTPGPWRESLGDIMAGNDCIAELRPINREYNAKLMAAAPELLQSLKALYEHYNTKCDKDNHGPQYDSTGHIIKTYCPRCDASAKAFYAIAKAEGKD